MAEHIVTVLPNVDVTFDLDAFDEAIRSQGVRLIHHKAMRCPVGMVRMDDSRRPHPHHEGCYNGYIYVKAGCVTAMLTGNSKKKSQEDVGWVDFSTIQCTLPRSYDNSEEKIVIAPFDRFYLDEDATKVVTWQLFEHHETGLDRMKYPVACVHEPIVDARGERFVVDVDFTVTTDGQVKWGARRPAPELDLGPGLNNGFSTDKGTVCSIRYMYLPYWYVGVIPHELRIVQVQNGFDRGAVRGPQMCVLHREYVSQSIEQNEDVLPNQSDEIRKVMAPMYGGFSPK